MNPLTRRAAVAAALFLAVSGCSARKTAPAVNPERARQALKDTLDHWRSGATIDDLRGGPKAITAQDFDWMSGTQLVSYQIEGDGQDDDANLRIPVTLTLRDKAGKESTKRVQYVVGTGPAITVFRDML